MPLCLICFLALKHRTLTTARYFYNTTGNFIKLKPTTPVFVFVFEKKSSKKPLKKNSELKISKWPTMPWTKSFSCMRRRTRDIRSWLWAKPSQARQFAGRYSSVPSHGSTKKATWPIRKCKNIQSIRKPSHSASYMAILICRPTNGPTVFCHLWWDRVVQVCIVDFNSRLLMTVELSSFRNNCFYFCRRKARRKVDIFRFACRCGLDRKHELRHGRQQDSDAD